MTDDIEQRACIRCGVVKPRTLDFFRSAPTNRDRLAGRCRACDSEKSLEWYRANKERAKASARAWTERNPDRLAAYREAKAAGETAFEGYRVADRERVRAQERARRKRQLASDRGKRAEKKARQSLNILIQRGLAGRGRNACPTVGCTAVELVQHIERQFRPGMTWANRGEWHIDHIRPAAAFDLADPVQRRAFNHFTNLQPLWAAENRAKGATETHEHHQRAA